ncbi:hypothetical protein [Streptomyces fulvoviolaceus]|uniref:hypothetical protein n=1 Tax=Streptomyces fulvoviolaceus TaxID=285535 RepID=UPI0021BFE58F|nr:hypothetical protein [Streptomyces fulvoviolaceus]MCT9080439.1 hypothetical protein [Streptomyces fulvoviolaceus]
MADTKQHSRRRALRREIAGTIGLLTDEQDFSAMRRYRTFVFDEYEPYLQQMEALLRSRVAEGSHTTVALFDPEEYAEFCADTGLAPDAPASRSRFTAEVAVTGTTIPYEGQPLAELARDLIDEAVRQVTQEYAAEFLSHIGPCATCGRDIGRAALARASELLLCIFSAAGPGDHHLVCRVAAVPETLVVRLRTDGDLQLDEAEALELTTVLAFGIAAHNAGGLVIRTSAPDTSDRVYGWRLRGDGLQPLTAAEAFDAYRAHIEAGDTSVTETNVDYCEPPDLGEVGRSGGHTH